jgi:hypothetical protein
MVHDRIDLPTDEELSAYLDEGLSPGAMVRIEGWIREDPSVRDRLLNLSEKSRANPNLVGAIWRKNRLSCPDRSKLGLYLLGGAEGGEGQYIQFHVETVGCRICLANLDDLRSSQSEPDHRSSRQLKIFQSSIGRISHDPGR